MKKQDYNISIAVDGTADEAFEHINNVTKWWTENLKGSSHNLNDEFTVHFGDVHYSKQKLIEMIPAKKIVWLVTESKLNFIKDKGEWTNTKIVFEIIAAGDQTEVCFTHSGLVPDIECFDACSNAWSGYIQGSLLNLINTGNGDPAKKEARQAIK